MSKRRPPSPVDDIPLPDALADFIEEAEAWLADIVSLLHPPVGKPKKPRAQPMKLRYAALSKRHLAALRGHQADVIRLAHDRGATDQAKPLAAEVIAVLGDFDRFFYHAVSAALLSQVPRAAPLIAASPANKAEELLDELELLGPLLGGGLVRAQQADGNEHLPALPPLTDAQKEVWYLLRNRELTAPQIRNIVDPQLCGSAIRQRIKGIRGTGRTIINRGVSGYYRPDAPPPID